MNRSLLSALASGAAGILLLTGCAPDAAQTAGSLASGAVETAQSIGSEAAETAQSLGSEVSETASSAASELAAEFDEADLEEARASLVSSTALTVCTHLPYPPFQSTDDNGEVVGFDVELIDLVAEDLGVDQQVVDTPFEGIKSGQDLDTGKCDIAAAGMTITPERQQVILFSDPYFDATQALLVRADATVGGLEDLQGKRVGAQTGTTGMTYANQFAQQLGFEVVEYNDVASEVQGLTTGAVDAAVNDLPVWSEFVKQNPDATKIAAQFDTGEQYGFGMKKGNEALKRVVDHALATAREDGTYDAIYQQWIGELPVS